MGDEARRGRTTEGSVRDEKCYHRGPWLGICPAKTSSNHMRALSLGADPNRCTSQERPSVCCEAGRDRMSRAARGHPNSNSLSDAPSTAPRANDGSAREGVQRGGGALQEVWHTLTSAVMRAMAAARA